MNKLRIIFSILFISILLIGCSRNETEDNNKTAFQVTVVDGYIKEATVTDSSNPKQIAKVIDANKGLYEFADTPKYPIKSAGGKLVDTDEAFDIEMSSESGNIISPISTLIEGNTQIKNNLLSTLGLSSEDELVGDYIKSNNKEVAKLAQLSYAMLKNSEDLTKFKSRIETKSKSNLTVLIDEVIKNDVKKVGTKVFLKEIKAYSGDVKDIEASIKNSKKEVSYSYKLEGNTASEKRASLNTLIANYKTAYNADNMSAKTKELEKKIKYADTSEITDFSALFASDSNFNVDISNWDTSKVTNMEAVFYYAKKFNQNIGSWDTSKVTNMLVMFVRAGEFNQDISSWDTSKVTNMKSMFSSAVKFNQNISSWNVSKVSEKTDFANNSPINGTSKLPTFP